MNYTTKDFRKNNFYILYSLNDDIICYLDNYEELSRFVTITERKIVYNFKIHRDFIFVNVNGSLCKLYTFLKD